MSDEQKNTAKVTRRQYYVKSFQMRFVTRFCLLIILGAVISGLILYFMTSSTVTPAFENSRLVIKSTSDYILPAIVVTSIVMVVVLGILSIFVIFMFSHRIAGPIYRLERHIESLAQGHLSKKVFLRGGDEVQELAELMNEMGQEFSGRLEDVKQEQKRLASLKGEMQELCESKKVTSDKLWPILEQFGECEARLKTKLDFFRTK